MRERKPWEEDTIASVFSTTKGISSIVMAWLVGQGALDYDARVIAYWPEFGAHGKDQLTLGQMLSHQAGLPGFAEPIDPALWLDPPALAAALADAKPLWPPGSASGYHPLTWGYLIGEVVQRASGRSLGQILRDEICAKLGVDFHIGLPEADDARVARNAASLRRSRISARSPTSRAKPRSLTKWASPPRGDDRWRRIEVPSANGHGNARSVARLYELFATGGEIAGTRVLSEQAYAGLIAPRIKGQDLVLPFMLDWRSGVLGNAHRFYGPNAEAFGHSGSGGSCGFGDAKARVSVGYVMNKQSPYLMGDPRSLHLIDAFYACL